MRILFVSTHDAARTQLAVGMARLMVPHHVTVQSAGRIAGELHPLVLPMLAEVGVTHRDAIPRELAAVDPDSVDEVISLSAEELPAADFAPKAARLHWPIDELPGVIESDVAGPSLSEARVRFRAAREHLRAHLRERLQRMTEPDDEA